MFVRVQYTNLSSFYSIEARTQANLTRNFTRLMQQTQLTQQIWALWQCGCGATRDRFPRVFVDCLLETKTRLIGIFVGAHSHSFT
jgi:hypothetical protein